LQHSWAMSYLENKYSEEQQLILFSSQQSYVSAQASSNESETGSNNPTGISSDIVKITFHPYCTIKDILRALLLILILIILVLFSPKLLGDPDNYTPANPLNTPPHIKPGIYPNSSHIQTTKHSISISQPVPILSTSSRPINTNM
ncbi:hypothetical protein E2I00_012063, partial [Balaenoptera physalus]